MRTVQEMGWAGKKNGELLQLLLGQGFEVLVTVDRNLPYQQNLKAASLAVIVLVASSNRVSDLKPLMPSVLNALSTIQPGQLVEITS